MKLSEVEIQADGKKATYFYTAEERVDFRELIRTLSSEFKMKVEMKQIGIRQEAGKVGGIGSCGRELCCSTWLTSFNSVSTSAARYQNLAINQSKLSGQCGRLKCCLNFELDTYMDALKIFPRKADKLKTSAGTAYLQKKDIFKNLLWYSYRGSSKLYPLSIERVNEIVALNKEGKEVDEMKPVELETAPNEEKELEYADTVGHISLKTLDKKSRQKRRKKSGGNRNRNQRNQGGNKKPANKKPQKRVAGWGGGGTQILSLDDNQLIVESTGGDPYISFNFAKPLPAGKLKLSLTMTSNSEGDGQVFWAAPKNRPKFAANRKVDFLVNHDGKPNEYEIAFDSKNPLASIRIDVSRGPGVCRISAAALKNSKGETLKQWSFKK
jgi:hypothetical protein